MPFTGPFEDRLAIRETLDAYADAVNQVDAKAWGSLWAEESMWSMPDYPEFGTVYGRANIVETWIAAMKQFPGVIFVATPGSIVVEGDQATVRSYTSEVYDDASGVTKRDRGIYDDMMVKVEGRWLFKSRAFRNIHRA